MALTVLAVDDEPPALDELAHLLRTNPQVGCVRTAGDAADALRVLQDGEVDAVFLDLRLPGLDGLQLARVLRSCVRSPALVFVTATEQAAVEAFELGAVDYVLKPLRPERVERAVTRVVEARAGGAPEAPLERLAVESGGVTRYVPVSEVRCVEAYGDYCRLHTASGRHLVRTTIGTLEERWRPLGFLRVHRSYLVALAHVVELRSEPGRTCSVRVGELVVPVSRRQTKELKDRLRAQALPPDPPVTASPAHPSA